MNRANGQNPSSAHDNQVNLKVKTAISITASLLPICNLLSQPYLLLILQKNYRLLKIFNHRLGCYLPLAWRLPLA